MKLSVIIPVYNVEPYIGECLQSVQEQEFGDLEILCINDAGCDGGWDIVRAAAEKDSRIRLAENEVNRGLCAVRNKGLELAQGDYVYFLDSDDKIAPGALKELYALAEENRTDAVIFCAAFLFDDECFKERFGTNPAVFKGEYPGIRNGKDLFVKWQENRDWMPSQPRYFYNREFLLRNNLRFQEGILHEDEIFAFDVCMCADRLLVRNEQWFIRRFRAGSIMTKPVSMKNVEGCIHILSHLSACAGSYAEPPALKDAVWRYRAKIAEDVKGKFLAVQRTKEETAARPVLRQLPDSCKSEPAGRTSGQTKTVETRLFQASENDPKISVLIPVYNTAPYLEECLESVLSQDFIDIEVICVDDASTDGSGEILKKYAAMDPRIRLYRQDKNRGQAAARNRAMAAARGEYLYMLDADDWILPGMFSRLYKLCKKDDADVIGFENRQFADDPAFEKKARTVLFTYEKVQGLYSGKDAFIQVVEQDALSPSVPTYMIRRSYAQESALAFTEGILHEDIGFIFSMLLFADRVRLVHEPWFCRRFRAHSTVTGGFAAQNAEGYLKSWQRPFECREAVLEKYGQDAALDHALGKWVRDVLGRIRKLYLASDEKACKEAAEGSRKSPLPDAVKKSIYNQPGGHVDEQTAVLFEFLKETATGRSRAAEILGEQTCSEIERAGAVYLCGSGQYLHRMIEVIGALEVEIKGVIMAPDECRGRKTLRGFRIFAPDECAEKELPVVLAVSHYHAEKYKKLLAECGFEQLTEVSF